MNHHRRLHSVLLTLWDIARDNPNYDRKLWGELQFCLSQLETRNNVLCALLADLLRNVDSDGSVLWDEASIHSPPEGFAVKFMQEELQREGRPTMPPSPQVIPTNARGEAVDLSKSDTRPVPPPLGVRKTKSHPPHEIADGLDDPITPPVGVGEEYDGADESDGEDLLAFDLDSDLVE